MSCAHRVRISGRAAVATAIAGSALVAGAAAASPASAATAGVAIHGVPGVRVSYGATTVIKPHVTTVGNAAVSRATLTVKRAGRTVAANVSSARLHAGTYAVTTRVSYRTYTVTTSYKPETDRIGS